MPFSVIKDLERSMKLLKHLVNIKSINSIIFLSLILAQINSYAIPPSDDDYCSIRNFDSFKYFAIDSGERQSKQGHDFPRSHETFQLKKVSGDYFKIYHPDSNLYLTLSDDESHLVPASPDKLDITDFELVPIVDLPFQINRQSYKTLSRFYVIKLDGEYINLHGNYIERKSEINREDLKYLSLMEVANMDILGTTPQVFDFIHAYQGTLNWGDTSFINFDFIDSKEIEGFKVDLYRRKDGAFQIFSFRGSSNSQNFKFDVFGIGANFGYHHPFREILSFIDSYKKGIKTYVSGQSMGGFLAQIFAVLSSSEGLNLSGPSAVSYLKQHHKQEYEAYLNDGFKFYNLGALEDKVPNIGSNHGHLGHELEAFHSEVAPPNFWELIPALFGGHKAHDHEVLNRSYFINQLESDNPCSIRWMDDPIKLRNVSSNFIGKKIGIKSINKKYYLSSNQKIISDSLSFAAKELKAWEIFEVVQDEDRDFIFLRDHWGWNLSVSPEGKVCQSGNSQDWEKFRILHDEESGSLYFESIHKSWLNITPNGSVLSQKFINNGAEFEVIVLDE